MRRLNKQDTIKHKRILEQLGYLCYIEEENNIVICGIEEKQK